ncbi:MAG: hypothetical protein MJA83_09070, partial [Gammaproteobacteria bacterium]|nr:hypothetical protein [Gammaproteobacteria bacterium]
VLFSSTGSPADLDVNALEVPIGFILFDFLTADRGGSEQWVLLPVALDCASAMVTWGRKGASR